MVRVGKSTHPAGGEIRKWKYCSAYSMKVKVLHITWKRKFDILQESESLAYYTKVKVWNITRKWKLGILQESESLAYYMKVKVWHITQKWKFGILHETESLAYYMNIRLLGNNEENYLTIDLAKASLFLFLEMVLLGFIFCTATQKNVLIQIPIDI